MGSAASRERFLQAARDGNKSVIRETLAKNPRYSPVDVVRAFHLAAEGNHVSVMRWIKSSTPIEMNALDERGRTAMHLTTCAEAIEWLVDEGCYLTKEDREGRTPLHWAALHASVETTEALLKHVLDPDPVDAYRETPLFIASRVGAVEIVRLLVQGGASPRKTNGEELFYAIHIAASEGHCDIVRFFVEECGVEADVTAARNVNSLHLAALEARLDVVQLLLDHGASIEGENEDAWTPLHFAAMKGSVEVVELLIERGADTLAPDVNGRTPLHWAAKHGTLAVVRTLAEADDNVVFAPTDQGFTPMHDAALSDNPEAIVILRELGGDIDARDVEGFTPVELAAKYGKVMALSALQGEYDESLYETMKEQPTFLQRREIEDPEPAENAAARAELLALTSPLSLWEHVRASVSRRPTAPTSTLKRLAVIGDSAELVMKSHALILRTVNSTNPMILARPYQQFSAIRLSDCDMVLLAYPLESLIPVWKSGAEGDGAATSSAEPTEPQFSELHTQALARVAVLFETAEARTRSYSVIGKPYVMLWLVVPEDYDGGDEGLERLLDAISAKQPVLRGARQDALLRACKASELSGTLSTENEHTLLEFVRLYLAFNHKA